MSRRAGSAALVHTRGGASAFIEYGTCGPWGHVAVADGEGNFVEAWPGGVRRVPESRYDQMLTADVDVDLTDEQRAAAVRWLDQQLRVPYNYAAIVVFVLKTLRADIWLGPIYRRFAVWSQNRKQTICSELWVNMLQAVGYDVDSLFLDRSMWPTWRRGHPLLTSEISPNAIGLAAATHALYYRKDASHG